MRSATSAPTRVSWFDSRLLDASDQDGGESRRPRQPARRCPASVPVHDQRDVRRDSLGIDTGNVHSRTLPPACHHAVMPKAGSPPSVEESGPGTEGDDVDGLLDDIAAQGPDATVDLVETFAFPLPFTVICGGLGVRIDSAVYQGYTIPPYYDSLVGKLIVHGKTRTECLMRLKRALDEVVVDGIETTLPLFRALVREKDIIDGNYHIHWLEQFLARVGEPLAQGRRLRGHVVRTSRDDELGVLRDRGAGPAHRSLPVRVLGARCRARSR